MNQHSQGRPQRLGKNRSRYLGETIDILQHLSQIEGLLSQSEWQVDLLSVSDHSRFIALRRIPVQARKRLYLSTGIHGDEPAGPLALLELIKENRWPKDIALWLCPCLNPAGFALNRRENAQGIDLNRQYRAPQALEVLTHIRWLRAQPDFDLTVCLHEDWEANGFYLYELNPAGQTSLAEKIIKKVAHLCPIENGSLVDGWPAIEGIIRPGVKPQDRPEWPEAIFLIQEKTQLGYTLEAPSDFPLSTRVAALVAGVRTVLDEI